MLTAQSVGEGVVAWLWVLAVFGQWSRGVELDALASWGWQEIAVDG